MPQNSAHIISSLKWNTTLDEKALAKDLQEHISHWSQTFMPLEVNRLFDGICPKEQTWQIKSLELDLGVIPFSELSTTLSEKFIETLEENLKRLLRNYHLGSQNIKISNLVPSQLETLIAYLTYGHLPWNHSKNKGSANDILNFQLKNNPIELRDVLMLIGKNPIIRKRLGWQFETETIKGVIKILEPSNHSKVIGFWEEITHIQAKTNLVKANHSTFKKQVAHWILDHLLVDRGTLFNMVHFVESNLRNISNHYNMEYEVLLNLIHESVKVMDHHGQTSSNLVWSLKLLSQKSKRNGFIASNSEEETYWLKLKALFSNPKIDLSPSEISIYNELVLKLSLRNPKRFQKMLASSKLQEGAIFKNLKSLSKDALETIFRNIAPSHGERLTLSVKVLEQSLHYVNDFIPKKTCWLLGMGFLLKSKEGRLETKQLLDFILTKISQKNHLKKLDLHANIRLQNGNTPSLATRKELDLLFNEEITKKGFPHFERYLFTILSKIEKKHPQIPLSSETLKGEMESLYRLLNSQPKWTLESFMKYHAKEVLLNIMDLVLDDFLAKKAITHLKTPLTKDLLAFKKTFDTFLKEDHTHNSLSFIDPLILMDGLKTLVSKPNLNRAAFFISLLEKLLTKVHTSRQLISFRHWVQSSLEEAHFFNLNHSFSEEQKHWLHILLKGITDENLLNRIKTSPNLRFIVSKVILLEPETKNISIHKLGTKNKSLLYNYLLQDKQDNHNHWVKIQAHTLKERLHKKQKIEISSTTLDELSWNCILDHESYGGNPEKLNVLFKNVLLLKYDDTFTNSESIYSIHGLGNYTEEELFGFLIKLLSKHKKINEQHLLECIRLALIISPHRLVNILSESGGLSLLKKKMSFSQFSLWVKNGSTNNTKEGFTGLNSLFTIFYDISSDKPSRELQDKYWDGAVNLLKTEKINTGYFKMLLRSTLHEVEKETPINAQQILSSIHRNNLSIPSFLRDLLKYSLNNLDLKESMIPQEPKSRLLNETQKEELFTSLVCKNQIPIWFEETTSRPPNEHLEAFMEQHPLTVYKLLKYKPLRLTEYEYLLSNVGFQKVSNIISNVHPEQRNKLRKLHAFQTTLTHLSIPQVTAPEIQYSLFKRMIEALVKNHWELITPQNVLSGLVWDLNIQKSITRKVILEIIKNIGVILPEEYHTELQRMESHVKMNTKPQNELKKAITLKDLKTEIPLEGISVRNAGLVIISDYMQLLFERLLLTEKNQFKTNQDQFDAVHYLQYVAVGMSHAEEYLLPLNKILCGLHPSEPIFPGVDIPEASKKIINGLIETIYTHHWANIGNTTLEGFRGNWFVRDGILYEHPDKWELTVDKKAYDLLLSTSPFSFSIIKHPWMEKPLHVNWPY